MLLEKRSSSMRRRGGRGQSPLETPSTPTGKRNSQGTSLTLDKADQGPRLRGLLSHPCSGQAHRAPTDVHIHRQNSILQCSPHTVLLIFLAAPDHLAAFGQVLLEQQRGMARHICILAAAAQQRSERQELNELISF